MNVKRRRKSFLTILMVCLILGGALQAADSDAGQIFIMDLGARSLGMGGAQVAVSDDLAAGRYNPAGLAFLPLRSVSLMRADMSQDRVQNVLQAGLPLRLFGNSVISLNYQKFGIEDIQCFNEDGSACGTIEWSDRVIWASYARQISHRFSAGLNIKFLKQEICTASADGFGFDLGFLYRMPVAFSVVNQLNLGLLIQDPEKMTIKWKGHNCAREAVNGNESEFIDIQNGFGLRKVKGQFKVPVNLRFGVAVSLFDDKGLFAFDWDKRSDLHIGGEYWIANIVGLRLGLNDSKFTAGGSVRFGSLLRQYQLDFAFERDQVLGNNTQATLNFRF